MEPNTTNFGIVPEKMPGENTQRQVGLGTEEIRISNQARITGMGKHLVTMDDGWAVLWVRLRSPDRLVDSIPCKHPIP